MPQIFSFLRRRGGTPESSTGASTHDAVTPVSSTGGHDEARSLSPGEHHSPSFRPIVDQAPHPFNIAAPQPPPPSPRHFGDMLGTPTVIPASLRVHEPQRERAPAPSLPRPSLRSDTASVFASSLQDRLAQVGRRAQPQRRVQPAAPQSLPLPTTTQYQPYRPPALHYDNPYAPARSRDGFMRPALHGASVSLKQPPPGHHAMLSAFKAPAPPAPPRSPRVHELPADPPAEMCRATLTFVPMLPAAVGPTRKTPAPAPARRAIEPRTLRPMPSKLPVPTSGRPAKTNVLAVAPAAPGQDMGSVPRLPVKSRPPQTTAQKTHQKHSQKSPQQSQQKRLPKPPPKTCPKTQLHSQPNSKLQPKPAPRPAPRLGPHPWQKPAATPGECKRAFSYENRPGTGSFAVLMGRQAAAQAGRDVSDEVRAFDAALWAGVSGAEFGGGRDGRGWVK